MQGSGRAGAVDRGVKIVSKRPRAARPASLAERSARRPSAPAMPSGGRSDFAPDAKLRPSTATRAAARAPCSKTLADRRSRRMPPPAGSMPAVARGGSAPTADSARRAPLVASRAPAGRMSARTTSAGCRSIRRATPSWRSIPAQTTAPGTVGRRSPCASPLRGSRSTRWRCWSTSRRCKRSRRGERPSPDASPDSATALRCAPFAEIDHGGRRNVLDFI